jgi:spore germination cell wall hydrolase CwlJ-like protein
MKLTSLLSLSLITTTLLAIALVNWETSSTQVIKIYQYPVSATTPSSLPKKIFFLSTNNVNWSKKDQDCLARNVFYEAGIESRQGKLAVIQVTHNRLKSGQWGNTICKVVYARNQFSWTANLKKRHAQPQGKLWKASQQAVTDYITGLRIINLQNSQHYHADYVNPAWGKEEHRVDQIGAHIFYDLSKTILVANKQQSEKVDR